MMRWALLTGVLTASLALAPAATANSLLKPNNDASLRPPHTAPYFNFAPRGGLRRPPSEDPGHPPRRPRNRRR